MFLIAQYAHVCTYVYILYTIMHVATLWGVANFFGQYKLVLAKLKQLINKLLFTELIIICINFLLILFN